MVLERGVAGTVAAARAILGARRARQARRIAEGEAVGIRAAAEAVLVGIVDAGARLEQVVVGAVSYVMSK